MQHPQKLCLKWNNHTINLLSVLDTFQQKDILVDVTLSCEGRNIKAHKMVLSACSPYFQNLFLENPCQHPIVIINGMKYDDIMAILNFMYKGEVNVSHEGLSSFLQAAEALKVKGLAEVCGGEKKSTNLNSQDADQGEPPRPQADTPTKKRHRNRKRSFDSTRSDDEGAPRKHKELLNSPEIQELSGDESLTCDMSSNGQQINSLPRVPQNVYSRSHQSSSNLGGEDIEDEYEVEPSKLLEQTLTTESVSMNNSGSSDNSLRIERIRGNATEMESSSLQEPESPPDIKPIIEYGESSAGPPEGSMLVYNEQSQPGPSNLQDGSLLHDNSHTQDENIPGFIVSDIMHNDPKNILLEESQKKKLRIIKCGNKKSSIVFNTIELKEDEIILIDGSSRKESPTKFRSPETLKYSIDVKSWVTEHHLGPLLITQLESGSCDVKHRKLLVRIVCAKMMKLCGSAYPSADFKEEVAKDIVRAFPGLRSKSYAQGHETFYDKSSGIGFLEFRLKTVRKSLNPSEKRRKPSRQKSTSQPKLPQQKFPVFADEDLLDSEILEKKVLWMQKQEPTESNKQAIYKALQETIANRQKEIKDFNMTITEVLTRYPRLKDYNGEMIECEFASLYPNYNAFLGVFESFYVPRLMQYTETNRPDLLAMVSDINDNALKALVLLPELLPSPNYSVIKAKKGQNKSNEMRSYTFNKKVVPNPELLMLLNEKENPDIASKEDASCMQPFLICILSEQKKIKQSFLQAGNLLITKCENQPLKAFDLLFKMHHVFNVSYAPQLRNFYDFIGGCIYKIYLPRACTDALNTIVCNMAVDLNRIL